MLYVGRDPGLLRPYVEGSRLMADIGDDMHAYLLTGQQQSSSTIWTTERTLTVS